MGTVLTLSSARSNWFQEMRSRTISVLFYAYSHLLSYFREGQGDESLVSNQLCGYHSNNAGEKTKLSNNRITKIAEE